MALAALGVETVVFDLDDYPIELLTAIAADLNLPLVCVRADFRTEAPEKYRGEFDAFFADPMSNEDCLDAFVRYDEEINMPPQVSAQAIEHMDMNWKQFQKHRWSTFLRS